MGGGAPLRGVDRRWLLAGAVALSACHGGETASARTRFDPARRTGPLPRLREIASFPVGTCLKTDEIADAPYAALVAAQCSQIVPEWEMQMERILRADGTFDFSAADRIAAFAEAHAQSLHGTSLVWYSETPPALKALDGDPARFDLAMRNYIAAVAGRYRGQAVSWDVVNEPVAPDGEGLRQSLYYRNMGGPDYVARAFAYARAADPDAVLVLNDYDLESKPAKRATFLRLAESLLRQGAPLGALGTQCHLDIETDPASLAPMMRDLAGLGLPVRVSELDVSFQAPGGRFMSQDRKLDLQARLYGATAQAFMALPTRQRLAFCTWGLGDAMSWRRFEAGGGGRDDQPLPFDDALRPKPAFYALADTL